MNARESSRLSDTCSAPFLSSAHFPPSLITPHVYIRRLSTYVLGILEVTTWSGNDALADFVTSRMGPESRRPLMHTDVTSVAPGAMGNCYVWIIHVIIFVPGNLCRKNGGGADVPRTNMADTNGAMHLSRCS